VNALVVAVDGPGGSGKSTVSRLLAERIGWAHLDTGAFYRAATLIALEEGIDPHDGLGVLEAISGRRFGQADGVMMLDGRDVSTEIRSEAVTGAVSEVSAHPAVRQAMVALQRAWVQDRAGTVAEGRDIGTVVFPDAHLKVFLTADPVERARRRAGETGADSVLVGEALARRDQIDSTRPTSPLRPADDAVIIDTTGMSIEAVVAEILDHLTPV